MSPLRSHRVRGQLWLTSRLPVRRGEISIVIVIEGDVAPGFERVRDVFGGNFENNGDVGAAVCVYRHGRKVVDLWGGLADAGTGRPWTRDTLQLVYSATKAATATCAHLLAQRGELDLDKPAAWYWPEFAAQGKADIPVRWLLSHRAGLPAAERGRVTRMVIDEPPGAEVANISIEQIPEQLRPLLAAFTDPDSLMNRAFAFSTPDIDFNSPEAQAAEIPSSNGICTADGLARLYAALVGEVLVQAVRACLG